MNYDDVELQEIKDALYDHWHSMDRYREENSLFRCVWCRKVGDCPVYHTKNYVKRQLQFCLQFEDFREDDLGED